MSPLKPENSFEVVLNVRRPTRSTSRRQRRCITSPSAPYFIAGGSTSPDLSTRPPRETSTLMLRQSAYLGGLKLRPFQTSRRRAYTPFCWGSYIASVPATWLNDEVIDAVNYLVAKHLNIPDLQSSLMHNLNSVLSVALFRLRKTVRIGSRWWCR